MIHADWFLRLIGNKGGFALPWCIIVKSTLSEKQREWTIRHERKHQEQWQRYWYVGFLVLYVYQYLKYGYWDMPLEIEAREAE